MTLYDNSFVIAHFLFTHALPCSMVSWWYHSSSYSVFVLGQLFSLSHPCFVIDNNIIIIIALCYHAIVIVLTNILILFGLPHVSLFVRIPLFQLCSPSTGSPLVQLVGDHLRYAGGRGSIPIIRPSVSVRGEWRLPVPGSSGLPYMF